MRKKIVAGNWKMNMTPTEAKALWERRAEEARMRLKKEREKEEARQKKM